MFLCIPLRVVGVPASCHGCYEQSDERYVFCVAVAILGRAEKHYIHGFDGYLLTMNGVLDAEHVRKVLHIVHREPKVGSREQNIGQVNGQPGKNVNSFTLATRRH